MLKPCARGNRVLVAIVMGSLAVVLLSLLLVPGELPVGAGLFALALIGAGLLAVWLTKHAASVRSAWGGGCFMNGILTIALGLRVQDDLRICSLEAQSWGSTQRLENTGTPERPLVSIHIGRFEAIDGAVSPTQN